MQINKFVTREITSEARRNFPLCDSVINKHTVNKINNKQDTGLKLTLTEAGQQIFARSSVDR